MPKPRSFIFTDDSFTLTGEGIATHYPTAQAAAHALRDDATDLVVGALPFHSHDAPALFSPLIHHTTDEPLLIPWPQPLPALTHTDYEPSLQKHRTRVSQVVDKLTQGPLEKVVLSRREHYTFDEALDPITLLAGFIHHSATHAGHLIDLSCAQKNTQTRYLVGSSPELLIAKKGAEITSHPLAGTVRRDPDPTRDREIAQGLMESAKNLHEHAFVTNEIRRVLAPLCTWLDIPSTPSLTRTSHTWHLGTPISGELADQDVTVLELAAMLHPTPAVNGYPSDLAKKFLAQEEPDRGFYAGACGYCDASGDGQWRVSIRSAEVTGNQAWAYAGGGIVADSDPDEEVAETRIKLGPVATAFGITR